MGEFVPKNKKADSIVPSKEAEPSAGPTHLNDGRRYVIGVQKSDVLYEYKDVKDFDKLGDAEGAGRAAQAETGRKVILWDRMHHGIIHRWPEAPPLDPPLKVKKDKKEKT